MFGQAIDHNAPFCLPWEFLNILPLRMIYKLKELTLTNDDHIAVMQNAYAHPNNYGCYTQNHLSM